MQGATFISLAQGYYLGDLESSIFNNKRVGFVMHIDASLSCLSITLTETNHTGFVLPHVYKSGT